MADGRFVLAQEPLQHSQVGRQRRSVLSQVAGPGRLYEPNTLGLDADIYNPPYFRNICPKAELSPRRSCFEPIYGMECLNPEEAIYGAPIAFWSGRYADVPNTAGFTGRSDPLVTAPSSPTIACGRYLRSFAV